MLIRLTFNPSWYLALAVELCQIIYPHLQTMNSRILTPFTPVTGRCKFAIYGLTLGPCQNVRPFGPTAHDRLLQLTLAASSVDAGWI